MLTKNNLIFFNLCADRYAFRAADNELKKKGFINVILSDFIRKELKVKKLSVNRENLQDIGDAMRQGQGSDILAKLAVKKIDKQDLKLAVIDGIRNLAEVKFLKKISYFTLVGVSATPDKRYKRLMAKKNSKSKFTNWQEFIRDELREDVGLVKKHGQQNQLCFLHSDYFIDNNASRNSLRKKILVMLNKQPKRKNEN